MQQARYSCGVGAIQGNILAIGGQSGKKKYLESVKFISQVLFGQSFENFWNDRPVYDWFRETSELEKGALPKACKSRYGSRNAKWQNVLLRRI